MALHVRTVSGNSELTMAELCAVVAQYAVQYAQDVLPVFEQAVPGKPRPRAAIEAAWVFIHGGARTALQRSASVDAHRAGRAAPSEAARLAAAPLDAVRFGPADHEHAGPGIEVVFDRMDPSGDAALWLIGALRTGAPRSALDSLNGVAR